MFNNKIPIEFFDKMISRPLDFITDLNDFSYCVTCTCCIRHQTNRPTKLVNGYIEFPWRGGSGWVREWDCNCACRMCARTLAFKYSNDNNYFGEPTNNSKKKS